MCHVAHRFHILLSREQYLVLDEEADRSGVSIAELIRRAIDTVFVTQPLKKVRVIDHSLGRRPGRRLA